MLAVLHVGDVWHPDREAEAVFGTADRGLHLDREGSCAAGGRTAHKELSRPHMVRDLANRRPSFTHLWYRRVDDA